MNINAVGINVSKGKSMVAIPRPYGEIVSKPFEVRHTSISIRSLYKYFHNPPAIIVQIHRPAKIPPVPSSAQSTFNSAL